MSRGATALAHGLGVEHATGDRAGDDGLSAFVGTRARLFGIAYRMLGSAVDAEDVVQETWVRWQTTDRTVVRNAAAFLATTTMRLAINAGRCSRSRRETVVEPCAIEAVEAGDGPGAGVERSEALARAVRLLLAKLSPTERAVNVLSEAFDYPYPRIAALLQMSEVNVRQLASRARRRLAGGRCEPVDPSAARRLLEILLSAAQTGRLAALEAHLTADVPRRRPVASW